VDRIWWAWVDYNGYELEVRIASEIADWKGTTKPVRPEQPAIVYSLERVQICL